MINHQFVLVLNANKNDSLKGLPMMVGNLEEGFELIDQYEPDLIIVYDNFSEDIASICTQIREKTALFRPILIVLSKEKKLELLKLGVDDYHDESIDPKELSLRIFAHLRRRTEESTDNITRLPYANLTYKTLRRNIKTKTEELYALVYLNIDNFEPYQEIYGHIAAEKLLQTFVAMIKTTLDDKDFFGQAGHDGLVIFTSPEKAEKIAVYLSYYFDIISPKFYNIEDTNRGYLILDGDEKVGRRVPLVSVSIGVVSNEFCKFNSFEEMINKAISVHRLAKTKMGSSWVSNRPQIAGEADTDKLEQKVMIVENDASLSYLLATTLEMQGYSAEILAATELNPQAGVIIFDINQENAVRDLEICRNIKKNHPHVKIIVSTTDCNKERILDSGVDLYIPKPYELMVLFNWISKFFNYEVL